MSVETIYKYSLAITDEQVIYAPPSARPLTVQFQNGMLCLWMRLDPKEILEQFTIRIYGTGNPIPADRHDAYLGTVQEHGGALVWHVFWVVK
jgi:hypothetical protein